MVGRWVGHVGGDFLEPDGVDSQSPFQVQGADDQIFQMKGGFHVDQRASFSIRTGPMRPEGVSGESAL